MTRLAGSVPDAELIAEAIPHIVWTSAPDGATTYFNRQGTDYTGCPREANYDWNWVTLIHPDDAPKSSAAWARATRAGDEYSIEQRIRRHDGAYRWHACRARPVRDDNGEIRMWIGTATDIEDQKQLELSLRRSEREALESLALLTSVEAATPIGFKLVDRDFRVVRINDWLARLNHRPAAEQIGLPVAELVPELWSELEGVYRRALAGESVSDVALSTADPDCSGRVQHWLASFFPVWIDGQIIGVGSVVVDVTTLTAAQRSVAHNVEAMVATIATTVECRDPYTAGHQRRVAEIAAAIAVELELPPWDIEGITTAASIHDIGKLSVPAELLSKPGRLSDAEFELIKQHAETGYEIVAGIEFP